MKDLQKAYQDWQKEQMNLSREFVLECRDILNEIFTILKEFNNCKIVKFEKQESTFQSAWLDNRGTPYCVGIFDEGYPQIVPMEYLTMDNKHLLHQILQQTLVKLKTESKPNQSKNINPSVWVVTEDFGNDVSEICGIFATVKLAESYIEHVREPYRHRFRINVHILNTQPAIGDQ